MLAELGAIQANLGQSWAKIGQALANAGHRWSIIIPATLGLYKAADNTLLHARRLTTSPGRSRNP